MIEKGQTLVNPVTGERMTFLEVARLMRSHARLPVTRRRHPGYGGGTRPAW